MRASMLMLALAMLIGAAPVATAQGRGGAPGAPPSGGQRRGQPGPGDRAEREQRFKEQAAQQFKTRAQLNDDQMRKLMEVIRGASSWK
jgi:hypothetical protein